jgi:putative endopeptidase
VAAARPVKLSKTSLSLKITKKAGKTTYGKAKIKLKVSKGVQVKSVKYQVKNKKIVKVSKKGKVTAKKKGKTKVVVSVRFQQNKKWQTKKLTVRVKVSKKVVPVSTDAVQTPQVSPSVTATVSPGSSLAETSSSPVTTSAPGSDPVSDPSKVSQIYLQRKNYITSVGGKTALNPQVLPETAKIQELQYVSADSSIATVNRHGVISGIQKGDTTITVQSTDGSGVEETVNIKVVEDAAVAEYVDDYYEASNASLIQEALAGSSQTDSEWSVLGSQEELVEERENTLIQEALDKGADNEKGSPADQIAALYETAQDQTGREQTGIGSLLTYVQEIEAADSIEDFLAVEAELDKKGIDGIFNTRVDITEDDSRKYQLYFDTSDYALSEYAVENVSSGNESAVRTVSAETALEKYVDSLFQAAGEKKADRKTHLTELKSVFRQFAVSYDSLYEQLGSLDETDEEEWLDALEDTDFDMMKEYTPQELETLMKNCNLSEYLEAAGYDSTVNVSVTMPGQLAQIDEYLTQDHLEELKQYAKYELLNQYGTCLTRKIYNNYAQLYLAENGESYTSYEDFAMEETESTLAWEICALYTETYESQEKKNNITEMANAIVEEYERELTNCSWMSDDTKENAIKKLSSLELNILYPDDYSPYLLESDLLLPEENGTLLENEMMISEEYAQAERDAVGEELSGKDWIASPLDVNSYYVSILNSVYICSGIIGDFVYEESRSDAMNYGALGMVIAHEVSHAFDAEGCQYDENGDLRDWWTEEDKNYYEEIQEKLIQYYDGFYLMSVNGKPVFEVGENTLSENIADLAGVACVVNLVEEDNTSRQEFFTGYANMWAEVGTLTRSNLSSILSDSHSVAKVRVNAVLSMLDEFYETYGVGESDGMYVAPEERIHIWR